MIGVFDSGVGGLGVWREVVRALPATPTVYLADQAHAPYGDRSVEEIRELSFAATRVLLDEGAVVVVVACNTASAAALSALRRAFPAVPFVGMEPAVKPAAAASRSGVIGILATRATLEAPGFAALVERHAAGARVVAQIGEGLVEAVEAGRLEASSTVELVRRCVGPLRAARADHVVLGCTHYPFLGHLIRASAGPGVTVVDPAPAVARRVADVWTSLPEAAAIAAGGARHRLLTSGQVEPFRRLVERLVPGVATGVEVEASAG